MLSLLFKSLNKARKVHSTFHFVSKAKSSLHLFTNVARRDLFEKHSRRGKRKQRASTNLCDSINLKCVVGCSKNKTFCMGTYWNEKCGSRPPKKSRRVLCLYHCVSNLLNHLQHEASSLPNRRCPKKRLTSSPSCVAQPREILSNQKFLAQNLLSDVLVTQFQDLAPTKAFRLPLASAKAKGGSIKSWSRFDEPKSWWSLADSKRLVQLTLPVVVIRVDVTREFF